MASAFEGMSSLIGKVAASVLVAGLLSNVLVPSWVLSLSKACVESAGNSFSVDVSAA